MGKLFGRVNYIILFGRSILKVAVYTNEIMKFVRLSVCFVIKVPHRKKVNREGKLRKRVGVLIRTPPTVLWQLLFG